MMDRDHFNPDIYANFRPPHRGAPCLINPTSKCNLPPFFTQEKRKATLKKFFIQALEDVEVAPCPCKTLEIVTFKDLHACYRLHAKYEDRLRAVRFAARDEFDDRLDALEEHLHCEDARRSDVEAWLKAMEEDKEEVEGRYWEIVKGVKKWWEGRHWEWQQEALERMERKERRREERRKEEETKNRDEEMRVEDEKRRRRKKRDQY